MKSAIFAAFMSLIAVPASAMTILAYDTVNGASVPVTQTAAGVTATDLQRGPGLSQNAGGSFNSKGWTQGGNLLTAILNGDLLGFGFTSTQALDLDTFEIFVDRSPTGPQAVQLAAFFNGGAISQVFDLGDPGASGSAYALDFSAFDGITDAAFQLLGYNATGAGGTLDIEPQRIGPSNAFGIHLSGDVSLVAVPLPAGAPLLLLALGAVILRRRKTA